MGNGPVPYLPPDEPYKYLGIFLTLMLNWGHQYRASLNLLVEQAAKLQSSFATPAQKASSVSEQDYCCSEICILHIGFFSHGYQEA